MVEAGQFVTKYKGDIHSYNSANYYLGITPPKC